MNAEIIAVGSELLTPQRLDTNSLFLTEKLNERGIEVTRKMVIGDDLDRLAAAITLARTSSSLLLITGGLGPTLDDLTRDAVAAATGRKLEFHPEIVETIKAVFQRMNREMAEVNRRQAYVLEGAEILPNPYGTAPGQWLEDEHGMLALLPGPPRELQPMVRDQVLPRLDARDVGVRLYTSTLRVALMGESDLEQRIHRIYTAEPRVTTTILAAPGDVQVHLRATGATVEEARSISQPLADKIAVELSDRVYTRENKPLEEVVGQILRQRDMTLAVAESCTGGFLAQKITSVPGCSDYFLGGWVTYSPDAKVNWLGVDRGRIETHGVVSAEIAQDMARGVRRVAGASVGVATTGIAGPGGDGSLATRGTVYVAVADEHGAEAMEFHIAGGRDRVRTWGSQAALELLRRRVLAGFPVPQVG